MANEVQSTAWFPLDENGAGNWTQIVGSDVQINSGLSYQFEVGEAVSLQLEASGDPSPTWSVKVGSLPDGLTLSTSGLISGTVGGTVGLDNVTIEAKNAYSLDTEAFSFQVLVTGGGTIPVVVSRADQLILVNTDVSRQLVATGQPDPTWSIVSGSLPQGVTLTTAGLLSGRAESTGDFQFTVEVVNSAGSAQYTYTMSVHQVPTITAPSKITMAFNQQVVAQLTAVGFPVVSWGISTGTLPQGVSLLKSGQLIGSPTAIGSTTARVTASNLAGAVAAVIVFEVPAISTGPGASTSSQGSFFAVF